MMRIMCIRLLRKILKRRLYYDVIYDEYREEIVEGKIRMRVKLC